MGTLCYNFKWDIDQNVEGVDVYGFIRQRRKYRYGLDNSSIHLAYFSVSLLIFFLWLQILPGEMLRKLINATIVMLLNGRWKYSLNATTSITNTMCIVIQKCITLQTMKRN